MIVEMLKSYAELLAKSHCKQEFKVPDGWRLVPADVVTPKLSWPLEIGVVDFEKANGAGCDLIECIYDAVHAMLDAAPEYNP